MGAIMESIFCIAYLIAAAVLGAAILKKSGGDGQKRLFGALTLTLVGGDAFHLVPRIYGNLTGKMGELTAALGFGTLVTSVTMTAFYVMLFHFWRGRFGKKGENAAILTAVIYALAACRVLLCLFPQNNWLVGGSLLWGVLRNIPFAGLGGVIVWLFFKTARTDKYFKWAWLAVLLSFLFYIPVVLFADAVPIVGMLMLPKTACYVWLVVMGYRFAKN